MQVGFFQSFQSQVLVFVKDVKEEFDPSLLPRLKKIIEKKYPIFADYEIQKAYMLSDYQIIVQLYNRRANDYKVVEL